MKPTQWIPRPAPLIATLALLSGLSPLAAQTASSPAADPAAKPQEEEPVKLSPFIVEAKPDEGYKADETLAGTRVRTNLKDLGSALTVVTKKFMQDIGATGNETLLQYTTNTEVGGIYGNFGGVGNQPQITETDRLLRPNESTRVRGLTSADNTRNFFITDIPWDAYNVDRVDMQRGANSILFGVGSPAGIINTNLNDARFRNAGSIQTRAGKYGSLRNSIDVNRVLLPDELALRVEGLDDDKRYQQEPAYNHDKRLYAALRYDPKFLSKAGAHTTFEANFERGIIHANRPRTLPPIDAITPWFLTGPKNLNQGTWDPSVAAQAGNVANTRSPTYIPWFNEAFLGRMFNPDIGYFYNNAGSGIPSLVQQAMIATRFGLNGAGAVDGSISGIPFARPLGIAGYNAYSRAAGLPGSQFNAYKDKFLTDPSIFDFYNHLIDGNNKWERQEWNALNLELIQSFFDNRVAFDLAYYHQKYDDAQEAFLSDQQYAVSVDVNSRLVDGSPNPNAGRPYVGNSGLYGNNASLVNRDSIRLTGTAELNATDFLGDSRLGKALGRHVFTGLVARDSVDRETRSWARTAADLNWADTIAGSRSISDGDRQIDWVTYLGPSLLGATSAANSHLSPVTATQAAAATSVVRYFDSHWNKPTNPADPNYVNPSAPWVNPIDGTNVTQSENPANYVGWVTKPFNILSADRGDIAQLYRDGAKRKNRIDSMALTWQGHLLNDIIVPTVGWRRDTVRLWSAAAPKDPVTKVASLDYGLGQQQAKQAEDSTTWSVVAHLPKRFSLPHDTTFSVFYNEGRNFKADQIRKDIEGRTIANPRGRTKDYGVIVSTLEDRVTLKVNWYETTVHNATLEGTGAGIGNNIYWMYLLEAWGTGSAVTDLRGLQGDRAVQGMAWYWDWANHDLRTPYGLQPRNATTAPVDAAEIAAARSWIAQLPAQSFFNAYGMPVDVAKLQSGDLIGGVPGWNPANGVGSLQSSTGGTINGIAPVATVDTISKGVEFELFARPTRNWDITINAARTNASRINLSATLQHWIMYQKGVFDSPAGDLRIFSSSDTTARNRWYTNIYGPYQFLVASNGSSAPEIRPWRANLVTNYRFDRGELRGFNLGAAYRWQQGEVLGYALNSTQQLDVSKPYRGASTQAVDLWVGYQRKLTDKLTWRIQLNTRDVGRKAHLVPISVEPDGSPAAFRIEEGMGWQLTNSFLF